MNICERGDGDSDVKRSHLRDYLVSRLSNPIDNDQNKQVTGERNPLTKMGDVHFDLSEWNGCYCKNFSKYVDGQGGYGSCERLSVVSVFLDMYTSQQFWGGRNEDDTMKMQIKRTWRYSGEHMSNWSKKRKKNATGMKRAGGLRREGAEVSLTKMFTHHHRHHHLHLLRQPHP